MNFQSMNPYNNSPLGAHPSFSSGQIEQALETSRSCFESWCISSFQERSALLQAVAALLRNNRDQYAQLITLEMGKLITEARAEVEKCALVCEFYAEKAESFLEPHVTETINGAARILYQPLGTILCVMPWNFPFWQVFRCASANIMAGNSVAVKHASNVCGCAMAIEKVFLDAGAPKGLYTNLPVPASGVADIIRDARISGVTLTGSDPAGRAVAATAGQNLKKCVLELGGSDPFVVLEDADIEAAASTGVLARFMNAGQSCIAAKRFIIHSSVADSFIQQFIEKASALTFGNPADESTTLAPMARSDLRHEVHEQVTDALDKGATLLLGGVIPDIEGAFYPATIIKDITPQMRLYHEEVFGPVAGIYVVESQAEALELANDTPFGLGGSVWTGDIERGQKFAAKMACGSAFINSMVKSDPLIPFGGIKLSGFGRELAKEGLLEFMNIKTCLTATTE